MESHELGRNMSRFLQCGVVQAKARDLCPELFEAFDSESGRKNTNLAEVSRTTLQNVADAGHIERFVREDVLADLHEARLLLQSASKMKDFWELRKIDSGRLVQLLDLTACIEAEDLDEGFFFSPHDARERGTSLIHGIPQARNWWEERFEYLQYLDSQGGTSALSEKEFAVSQLIYHFGRGYTWTPSNEKFYWDDLLEDSSPYASAAVLYFRYGGTLTDQPPAGLLE